MLGRLAGGYLLVALLGGLVASPTVARSRTMFAIPRRPTRCDGAPSWALNIGPG